MRASIRGAGTRLALSAAAAAALITAGGAAGAVGAQTASAATVPAAVASTAASTVAVRPIHQVRCTRTTFQVSYRADQALREKCYEGTGRISPDIRNVRVIRTGVNTGLLTLRSCRGIDVALFKPGETFKIVSPCPVTLEVLDISRA